MNINILRYKMAVSGTPNFVGELAKVLNVSRQAASNRVNGKTRFSSDDIRILRDRYNLTPEEVVEIFI